MNYKSRKPAGNASQRRSPKSSPGGGTMSRSSRTQRDKKGKATRSPRTSGSIWDIFKSREYRKGLQGFGWSFVGGLVLLFASIFFVGSFASYITTGAMDQSLFLSSGEVSDADFSKQMGGVFGVHGAKLMHMLVNGWLGLGMLFIFFLIAMLGYGILFQRRIPYLRISSLCIAAALWCSAALAIMPESWTRGWFFLPGGAFGKWLVGQSSIYVGVPGVLLVLILLLLVLLYASFAAVRQRYMQYVQRKQMEHQTAVEHAPMPEYDEQADTPMEVSQSDDVYPEDQIDVEYTNSDIGEVDETSEWYDHDSGDGYEPEDRMDYDADDEEQEEPMMEDGDEEQREESTTSVRTNNQPQVDTTMEDGVQLSVVDARHEEEYVPSPQELAARLVEEQGPFDPRKGLSHYRMPDIELLKKYNQENDRIDEEEIRANKQLISDTLRSFKIDVLSITATVGPAITLYEIVPAQGVHISRIKGLEDNISMSLSALGIRIIAPMPGKGTIGMEVPNKKPQIVSMRSVIASKAFSESDAALPVALGKTITNDVFVFDLAKVPHLLVAGATGQGKSVGLNAIITSLLYRKHPSELKFVMVDPKMVEFSMYALIEKHYMAKLPDEPQTIITDTARVATTLNSLCQEMDDRYELLAAAHVRNIKEYNEKFAQRLLNSEKGHRYLPYIVLIIDEYGDLLITAGKEIETPITRLAQKARAVGIHAIIATQRPTASIITGAIKSNFPGRIAFRVTSQIDSRIILDATGANRLVGKGDLLYSSGNDLTRVQCAFVDTPEVNRLVEYIGDQQGYPHAYPLPEVAVEGAEDSAAMASGAALDPNKRDAFFDEVAERLVAEQKASISFIQQTYAVGYNRAARLMIQLEAAGIVGPADGQKQREVLVKSYDQLARILHPDEE